jgi:hypothetical protein
LLNGPLKHIRAAALAAALLPLASVAATPASAQERCASAGACGTVFDDANNNGVRDTSELGIEGVKISVCQLCDDTDTIDSETGPEGLFLIEVLSGPMTVSVLIPTNAQASPPDVGDDAFDSDGEPNDRGFSVAFVVEAADGLATDFGFFTPSVVQPGTGTPGYWKNHPHAWPAESIVVGGKVVDGQMVGGQTYTRAEAIAWLGKVGKDKSTTMFSSLVPAMLNIMIGNDGSCVKGTIEAANAWMAANHVGSNVTGSSDAWTAGEPLHVTLDSYNNGLLCAPHRN